MDKQSRSFVQAVKDAATEFAATRDERRFDYSVTSAREAVLNYVASAAGAIEGKPKIGYGGAKGLAVLQALAAHSDWKVAQVAEAAGCSVARVNEVIRFLEWEGNSAAEALAKLAESKPAAPVTEAPAAPVAEPAPKEPHKSKPLNIVMEPVAASTTTSPSTWR